MKFTLFINPEKEEEVIVCAHEESRLTEKIRELVSGEEDVLLGYGESTVVCLDPSNVVCFTSEDGKVFAHTANETLLVKLRLYQLEERFGSTFVKINQSCLVRTDKIKRFHSSIGGSLMVTMEGGYRDYISRRQLKTVKERFGIK